MLGSMIRSEDEFVAPFLENYMSSSVCLSSVICLTFVHSTQAIEILAIFLRHLVLWQSVDIQVKLYAGRPRGTRPSGELNTRGVAEYSYFGPIERYISEMVQDRGYVCINH